MVFDEVFHGATAAVDRFAQKRETGAFKTGHDEADVITTAVDFRHDDYSEFPVP